MAHPGIPIPATEIVDVYWGNSSYAIHITRTQMNMALSLAREWFWENDHYFHPDNFPPYQRMWGDKKCVKVDYGSHAHYLYCIPAKL